MKKAICILMAVVFMMTPMNCLASGYDAPSNELKDFWSEGESWFAKGIDWTTETQVVAFKPTQVTVTAQKSSFVVNANVTTTCKNVIVQWSRDPHFKKGVSSKIYRNANCKGRVISQITNTWIPATKTGKDKWQFVRILKQGKTVLNYRKVTISTAWDYLNTSQWVVNQTRKKVAYMKRMYVPNVKNPKGLYVRVLCAYDGITQRSVYSPLSATVKVK